MCRGLEVQRPKRVAALYVGTRMRVILPSIQCLAAQKSLLRSPCPAPRSRRQNFMAEVCASGLLHRPAIFVPANPIHGVWSNALCGRQRPPAESAGLVVVCCASLADQMICIVCSATPRICTLTLVCACAGALAGMAALQFSDIRCARAPHTCCMPHLSCYTPLTLSVVSIPSVLHQALRVTRLHVHHRTALLREHVRR